MTKTSSKESEKLRERECGWVKKKQHKNWSFIHFLLFFPFALLNFRASFHKVKFLEKASAKWKVQQQHQKKSRNFSVWYGCCLCAKVRRWKNHTEKWLRFSCWWLTIDDAHRKLFTRKMMIFERNDEKRSNVRMTRHTKHSYILSKSDVIRTRRGRAFRIYFSTYSLAVSPPFALNFNLIQWKTCHIARTSGSICRPVF